MWKKPVKYDLIYPCGRDWKALTRFMLITLPSILLPFVILPGRCISRTHGRAETGLILAVNWSKVQRLLVRFHSCLTEILQKNKVHLWILTSLAYPWQVMLFLFFYGAVLSPEGIAVLVETSFGFTVSKYFPRSHHKLVNASSTYLITFHFTQEISNLLVPGIEVSKSHLLALPVTCCTTVADLALMSMAIPSVRHPSHATTLFVSVILPRWWVGGAHGSVAN